MAEERNEFYATRAEANKAVDRWIGRGYVGTGLVYNPEYAEQEGKASTPYVVIIVADKPKG